MNSRWTSLDGSWLEALAPTHRFVLQASDALFPDTPWSGVQAMIDAWREYHSREVVS